MPRKSGTAWQPGDGTDSPGGYEKEMLWGLVGEGLEKLGSGRQLIFKNFNGASYFQAVAVCP